MTTDDCESGLSALPAPDATVPKPGTPAASVFILSAEQLASMPPAMGGPKRKTPRKNSGRKSFVDLPDMLVPVSEMTDEKWGEWEWPAPEARLPSNTRQAALTLWRRDGNICQVCGLKVDIKLRYPHPGFASIDHIQPLRRYQSGDKKALDTWGNVRLAHGNCNTAHGDFPAEFIAVQDYRDMLRAAISSFEATGKASPPATALLSLDSPRLTPAWEREAVTGRPKGRFGEEWTID